MSQENLTSRIKYVEAVVQDRRTKFVVYWYDRPVHADMRELRRGVILSEEPELPAGLDPELHEKLIAFRDAADELMKVVAAVNGYKPPAAPGLVAPLVDVEVLPPEAKGS